MGTGSAVCRQLKRLRAGWARGSDLDAHMEGIAFAIERGKDVPEKY
jgi:hypothetical protein